MSDLDQALNIIESKFGKIGNVKALLVDGKQMTDVAADLLTFAKQAAADEISFMTSYPEPGLNPA